MQSLGPRPLSGVANALALAAIDVENTRRLDSQQFSHDSLPLRLILVTHCSRILFSTKVRLMVGNPVDPEFLCPLAERCLSFSGTAREAITSCAAIFQ